MFALRTMNGIDEATHVPKVKDIIERPIRGDQVKAVIARRCCRSGIGLGFLPHSVLTLADTVGSERPFGMTPLGEI